MLIRKFESHSNHQEKSSEEKNFHGIKNYINKERKNEKLILRLLGEKKKSNRSISKTNTDYANQLALLPTMITMNGVAYEF